MKKAQLYLGGGFKRAKKINKGESKFSYRLRAKMNQISSHASHGSFTKRGTISFTSLLVHCIHHFNSVFKLFSFYFILQFSRESCLKLDVRTFTIISLNKYFSAILKRKELFISLFLAANRFKPWKLLYYCMFDYILT